MSVPPFSFDGSTGKPLVAYLRKSPVGKKKNYGTGLGIEAQKEAIQRLAEWRRSQVAGVYTEAESGRNDRPQLRQAIAHARRIGGILVVARLDRMARNTRLFLELLEGGVEVAFCDLPQIPPGPVGAFLLPMLAAVAQLEAGMISERTKAALAAARRQGVKLGGENPKCRNLSPAARRKAAERRRSAAAEAARTVEPVLKQCRAEGLTLQAMADRMNEAGHTTRRGRAWTPTQVARVLARLGL